MTTADHESSRAPRWIYEAVVFGTMALLLFFMMAGIELGMYAAGIAGAAASSMLGYLSAQLKWVSVTEGIKRVGILWLYVVGFAALSLLNGKWEPAAFAAVMGLTMTAFYAIGARLGLNDAG